MNSDVFRCKLFADDLKGYNMSDYRSNSVIIQEKLDVLIDW